MIKEKGKKEPEEKPNKEVQAPEQASKEACEYKEMLQRLQAEFENYRKRVEKEKAQLSLHGNAGLVQKLLPLLDSFELALENKGCDLSQFIKGVELIYAQFRSVLESEGLCEIQAKGQQLDPYKHEVLMKGQSDKEGVVLEEFQKGYVYKGIVIRHSKVKVGEKEAGSHDIKGHANPGNDTTGQ